MIITAGNVAAGSQAGRQGIGAVAEILDLIHKQKAERARLGLAWPAPGHTFSNNTPPTPSQNSFIDWGPSLQIYEPMGDILIQTITATMVKR